MTPEQENEIDELVRFLGTDTRNASTASRREKSRRVWDSLVAMREELEGLRAFKRNVDEALNSGDGSYRP